MIADKLITLTSTGNRFVFIVKLTLWSLWFVDKKSNCEGGVIAPVECDHKHIDKFKRYTSDCFKMVIFEGIGERIVLHCQCLFLKLRKSY